MKNCVRLILIMAISSASAWGLRDSRILSLCGCSIAEYNVLDTTFATLTYRFTQVQDTLTNWCRTDYVVVQAAGNHTKSYGLKCHLHDLNYTKRLAGQLWTTEDKKRFQQAGDGAVDYELYCNRSERTIRAVHHIPFTENQVIEYEEPKPDIKWTTTDESIEIATHTCWKATADWGGRHWVAWYAPALAFDVSPWKIGGLPGAILQLEESRRQFVFECIEIRQTQEPVYYYSRPTLHWSKKQWRTFDRNAHLSPQITFGNRGETEFHEFDPQTKTRKPLDASWTIPYNPIERE